MISTPSVNVYGMVAATLVLAGAAYPFPHAVSHAWEWERGNLVQNWSFENELAGWTDETGPGTTVDTRYKIALDGFGSRSGLFAAKVAGNHSGSSRSISLSSGYIPVRNGQAYTLSFYIRSLNVEGVAYPILYLRREKVAGGAGQTPVVGMDYSAFGMAVNGSSEPDLGAWTLYTLNFTTSAEQSWLEAFLWASNTDGTSGAYYFEEVVLEEGTLSSSEVLARRARIGHTVAYSDAMGRTLQEQTQLPTSSSGFQDYLQSGSVLDDAGRQYRSLLPSVQSLSSPTPIADPLAASVAFYDGVQAPDADGFPFSEVQFAGDPSGRAIRSGSPGEIWSNGQGNEIRTGFYFVNEFTIPSGIETPPNSHSEGEYRFDWRKDEEQNYSLTWTNRKGQVVQSAVNVKSDGSQWAVKRKEYYPNGMLRKVHTPLDAPGGSDGFAETWSYDAGGNVISTYTKDRGLLKYFYDRQGQLRFSQDEEQRLLNEWTYIDKDQLGNVVSVGTQVIPAMNQSFADLESHGTIDGVNKVERKGFLYGGLEAFEQRTGIPLSSVFPVGFSLAASANRLACSYHNNADVGGDFTAAQRLVADFFEYNQKGQVTRQFKYIGAVAGPQKLQAIAYTYDEANRPLSSVLYKSPFAADVSVRHDYEYDMLGRMVSVRGKDGAWVARYEYEKRGTLKSVLLGGNDSKTNGLRVDYRYHIRGWLKEVKAFEVATGKEVFAQYLGYEDRAVAETGVPSLSEVRRNGLITQQLYKLTSELDHPVRLVNYRYDETGRMVTADFQRNSSPSPLDGLQRINYPLSLANVDDMDTRLDYDLNGRITGKRGGGISSADSAVYTYQPDSYKLDHVTGKLTHDFERVMSNPGTFDYDSRGAMVEDRSKGLKLVYGYDLMPARIEAKVPGGTESFVQYQFYDAQGIRTSQVTRSKRSAGMPNFLVGEAEAGEDPAMYDYPDLNAAKVGVLQALQALSPQQLPPVVTLYVIPAAGTDLVTPDPDEFTFFEVGGNIIHLHLDGVIKHSAQYLALLESFQDGPSLTAEHHVNFSGLTAREIMESFGEQGDLTQADTVEGLFGRGAKVGRVTPGNNFEFFVKNHSGSTIRTVSATGVYDQGAAYDYQPYGELKTLRDGTFTVTEKWTGKQLLTLAQLYYFGARYYDAQLGLWLTPDPKRQFFDPYAFGGDPVNFVDPNGEELILASILIGAAIGAYMAGSMANQNMNLFEWNYARTWDEILIGGIAGAVAGGAGAYVGGAATTVNSTGQAVATGSLGWGKTAGLIASSTSGSFTSWALSGGEGEVRSNFGAFDVNWNEAFTGEQPFNLHNPFDDDPLLQNIGDLSGWLTNVQDLHYLRNSFNDVGSMQNVKKNYEILGGDNPNDPTGKSVAKFHLQGEGNEHNLKMVEKGKVFLQKEAVVKHHLDHLGKVHHTELVTDPRNMGTLNLVGAGKWNTVGGFAANIGHGVADVVPYLMYGNALNDQLASNWNWIYAAGASLSY